MYKNIFLYILVPFGIGLSIISLLNEKNDAEISNISEENYYLNDTLKICQISMRFTVLKCCSPC